MQEDNGYHTDGGGYADAAGYDLGSYAVPPDPRYAQPPQHPSAPLPHHQPAAYQAQHGPAAGYADDRSYANQQMAGLAARGHDQHVQHDQDDIEYETEPRRSRRWLIVVALIGSIGVGGGMAYAYKTMFASKPGTQTQVVKAGRDPVRTAPDNPGGKRLANADSKFMNKLESDAAGDTDANGVRKVQTVVVGADRAVASAPTQQGRPSSVPGMTIVGGDGVPGPGSGPAGLGQSLASAPMAARSTAAPVAPAAAPPRAQTVARAAPVAAPAPASTMIDGEPAAKPAAKHVAPKQAVPKTAAAGGAATAATAAAPKGKGGYVAVLGYQKSQIDAMKQLADMQQKYDVLRDKTLNVVESDQTARGLGMIYRIVVGPAGGQDAAKGVCAQLIQAGHPAKDCYTIQN